MPRLYSVEDILSNIEFELAQGVVARDELGEAVQAVRQFQNKTRAEVFRSLKLTDGHREFISRQFQVNDMLLNLLYEMIRVMQALQLTIHKLRQLPEDILRPVPLHPDKMPANSDAPSGLSTPLELSEHPAVSPGWRSMEEIEYVMRPEAIRVESYAQPSHWPVIGWPLTRLKNFFHRPALFYTQLFSDRQAAVNRVLGDRILYLENVVRGQQRQIQTLSAQCQSQTDAGGENEGAGKVPRKSPRGG